jgi:hypothetical protein
MRPEHEFFVAVEWDEEAQVWYVADSDVPGLATEAPSMDQMIAKLKVMVPELLEENGVIEAVHAEVPFALMANVAGISSRT